MGYLSLEGAKANVISGYRILARELFHRCSRDIEQNSLFWAGRVSMLRCLAFCALFGDIKHVGILFRDTKGASWTIDLSQI